MRSIPTNIEAVESWWWWLFLNWKIGSNLTLKNGLVLVTEYNGFTLCEKSSSLDTYKSVNHFADCNETNAVWDVTNVIRCVYLHGFVCLRLTDLRRWCATLVVLPAVMTRDDCVLVCVCRNTSTTGCTTVVNWPVETSSSSSDNEVDVWRDCSRRGDCVTESTPAQWEWHDIGTSPSTGRSETDCVTSTSSERRVTWSVSTHHTTLNVASSYVDHDVISSLQLLTSSDCPPVAVRLRLVSKLSQLMTAQTVVFDR